MGTCQACGGGGVVPPSSVEVTWISKQYWVSGQSGVCLLTRDWNGECDEVLPDASISSGPIWPFSGVRVWSSIWMVAPNFWSSRSIDWVAINAEQSTVSWNCRISLFRLGTKAHARKFPNCLCSISTRQLELLLWRAGLTAQHRQDSPIFFKQLNYCA